MMSTERNLSDSVETRETNMMCSLLELWI
jgi:hypothetical protein